MTIRATIALLLVPLFLGLALVNGALLHFQDRAEMERALHEQARVTAVTIAEFVRPWDDPAQRLTQAARAGAIRAALGHVAGLEALYLVEPGQPALALKPGSRPWNLASLRPPAAAHSFVSGGSGRQDRWVVAVAPAGGGRFVAARFSAEPIDEHMATVRRTILMIVLTLALLATGLALFVARRITRELDVNRRALATPGDREQRADPGDLAIREAQDLADAVRLMEASQRAAQDRRQSVLAHRERLRDPDEAIRQAQSRLFAPHTIAGGEREIAMRLVGAVPPGSFFAHAQTGEGGTLVIGCCRGDHAVEALAAAQDARRLIEQCDSADAVDRMLARLRTIHGFDALQSARWTPDAPGEPRLLAIADAATMTRAQAWCRANANGDPATILASLAVMLAPQGVFALIGPATSGERRERGLDVGFDREDGAEAADVEDFAHRGREA